MHIPVVLDLAVDVLPEGMSRAQCTDGLCTVRGLDMEARLTKT